MNIAIDLDMQEFGLPTRRKPIPAKNVAKEYPGRLRLLLDGPEAPLTTQIKYGWNPNDSSENIIVKEDMLTMCRPLIMSSTDAIRGKVGLSEGLHVWKVYWPIWKRGTNASIGVGTAAAPLHSLGYINLVGSTADSWGWDIVHAKVYHASNYHENRTYPVHNDRREVFRVPSNFFLVLDMDAGTLGFIVDGVYLGVAFDGLAGQTLYPIVSSVWGRCEVTLSYVGGLIQEAPPLKDICRRFIRKSINKECLGAAITNFEIPVELKTYLLYNDADSAYNKLVLPNDDDDDV